MRGRPCGAHARGGFTLAESLIASVVLAVSVAAIAGSLSASYYQSKTANELEIAMGLGQELMEEISALPFNDPDTGTASASDKEAQRTLWDNVGDYDGHADLSPAVTTPAGEVVAAGDGSLYSRTVRVSYRQTPSGASSTSGQFALVQVTVLTPTGKSATLSKLVAQTEVVQ